MTQLKVYFHLLKIDRKVHVDTYCNSHKNPIPPACFCSAFRGSSSALHYSPIYLSPSLSSGCVSLERKVYKERERDGKN